MTLTGREYTRFDGRRVSSLESATGIWPFISDLFGGPVMGDLPWRWIAVGNPMFNDAGHVVGYSTRYDPASSVPENNLGQTAWLYKNGSYIKLGIRDAAHTAADGTQNTIVAALNQAGQVAGASDLYNLEFKPAPCDEAECHARTAWFYDPGRDQIYRLVLSTSSDGFSLSQVISLSEDGTVLGFYLAFEDGSDAFQWRLFTFSVANGLQNVEISGFGLDNWQPSGALTIEEANSSGHFVGTPISGSGWPLYLFSPLQK